MKPRLKVLIDARLSPGGFSGGVEQFIMGLVYGLGRLTDGGEEYTLITRPESPDWLSHLTGANQTIVRFPAAPPIMRTGYVERAKQLLGPLRFPAGELRLAMGRFLRGVPQPSPVPVSNGFYESLGGNLIHFPFWEASRCRMPSLFNLWDLMQLHYPSFWTRRRITSRSVCDRSACENAQAVVAASAAVKLDIQQQYGVNSQKIFVIPCAPPVVIYDGINDDDLRGVRERYHVRDHFALFPAQTFAHKNHIKLLEALHVLRKRTSISLNLICTGTKNSHWPKIERQIKKLGLRKQVQFLGFVPARELRALYRLADFVVFPSLFEGAGLPVIEALQEGCAVTCSDIAPLREYAGDAALTFNPHFAESIATSLHRLCADHSFREQLRERGRERARLFTWERTARTYRALYRKVARIPLCEEEERLLTKEEVC